MTSAGRLILLAVCTVLAVLAARSIYDQVGVDQGHSDPRPGAGAVPSGAVPSDPVPAAHSTLWLLAIGVSRYAAPELNLMFAEADARAMVETMQQAAKGWPYREVRTLLLTNEEVTRGSMLDSLARFLGGAGPDDVAALFVAGHGVRDLESGSYYFLPHPATADNLLTEGLRMTDFDEMLRLVRRNVRAVVVMLDTCHAGALGIPSTRLVSADEMAALMSAGEGFFLLAATKPGEESKEKQDLGHGAFTYAVLEALRGSADADGDGALTVSELFGYVARRVPDLTQGQQHPYHKMEGTDLVFLSVAAGAVTPRAEAVAAPPRSTPSGPPAVNTIGVMQFQNLRAHHEYDWISKALRVAFNTELSKVKALRVYSAELIDRTSKARGADALYTARELGIGRLLTGSFHVTGNTLRIDARIVDANTGVNEASDSVEGDLDRFFDLQKQLVLSMLRRMRVEVSAAEGQSIQTETNTDVNAYRLLLEAEGVVEPPPTERSRSISSQPEVQSFLDRAVRRLARRSTENAWLGAMLGIARADEPDAQLVQEARAVLERYRRAIEAKDINEVALLYASFSQRQEKALRDYLRSTTNLRVEVDDVTVTPHESGMAVTFIRRDHFVDAKTSQPVHLEVRLTKILVQEDATWKMSSGK